MRGLTVYALTYLLAAFFAIAGMGAAGVLIPNYVTLGLTLPLALTLALTQNVFELTVATILNHRMRLVEWRRVAPLAGLAAALVPAGFYIHVRIPHVAVLTVFEVFLLYVLYSLTLPREAASAPGDAGGLSARHLGLAALQGLIAGMIGMDAAPIAILAYNTLYGNPKKVSANTAATALLVSLAAWLLYAHRAYSVSGASTLMLVSVGIAGLLGGVTGAKLMHKVKPGTVKLGMKVLLAIAAVEVYAKILAISLADTATLAATQATIASTLLFLLANHPKLGRARGSLTRRIG